MKLKFLSVLILLTASIVHAIPTITSEPDPNISIETDQFTTSHQLVFTLDYDGESPASSGIDRYAIVPSDGDCAAGTTPVFDNKGTTYTMIWYANDSVDVMVVEHNNYIDNVNTNGWWNGSSPYNFRIYEDATKGPYFCQRFTWMFDFTVTQDVTSSFFFIKTYRDEITAGNGDNGDRNPNLPKFTEPKKLEEELFSGVDIERAELFYGTVVISFALYTVYRATQIGKPKKRGRRKSNK